jgi:hypothetical protein
MWTNHYNPPINSDPFTMQYLLQALNIVQITDPNDIY